MENKNGRMNTEEGTRTGEQGTMKKEGRGERERRNTLGHMWEQISGEKIQSGGHIGGEVGGERASTLAEGRGISKRI